jgi:hypothetical protein
MITDCSDTMNKRTRCYVFDIEIEVKTISCHTKDLLTYNSNNFLTE